MWYVFEQFWLYILAAFVLGLIVGWVTFKRWNKAEADHALLGRFLGGGTFFPLAVVLFAIGLLLAFLKVFPNEAGLFLDMALWLIAAYLVGCILGFVVRFILLGDERVAVATAGTAGAVAVSRPAPPPAAPALPVARPYAWSAVKSEASTTLSGVVPSDTVRSRIVAATKAAQPGVTLIDRMTLASGAPNGFEGMVTTGVAQLGRLTEGKAEVVDTVYSITGRAPSREVYSNVMKGTSTLPSGFQLGKAEIAAPAEAAAPVASAPVAVSAPVDPNKPPVLAGPRGGKPDDLKRIRGIGPQNEGRLHALGIWHFDQIAAWSEAQVEWVGEFLAFPGRIEREEWVPQAKVLATGADTEFSKRVARGEVATSLDDGSLGQKNVGALLGKQPAGLSAPRGGKPDDLKLITGVGRAIEEKLQKLGIWHFDQLSAMSKDELEWVSLHVGFPGRALRENWAGESRILAAGGETEHSKAVKAGKIPSSLDDPKR